MSAGGMALRTPTACEPGERVVAYLDNFGRIEGVVARSLDDGFAVKFVASLYKREKIVNQLTWLINRERLGGFDRGPPVQCRGKTEQTGAAQRVGIVLAVIMQHIAFGSYDDRRSNAGKVRGFNWRGAPVLGIFGTA